MSESPEPRSLPSSAERRLRQLRGDLVVQLFTRRGPLWGAVRDVRDRWGITAKNQLPPPVVGRLLPEGAPDFRDGGYEGYVDRWQLELFAIRAKVDPQRHLTPKDFFGDEALSSWNEFLSACVLSGAERSRVYEMLRLEVTPDQEGYEVSGTLCNRRPTGRCR